MEESRQQWLPSACWQPGAEVTPETSAAVYALKAKRVLPSRYWWELFLLPGARRHHTHPHLSPSKGHCENAR